METFLEIDPLTEFFEAIRSPLTKDRYEHRFDIFLLHAKMEGSDLRERAATFAAKAKRDPSWATFGINEYMRFQKSRAERKEIAESTLANFWKPIKLFCEQNDIILNWRKITRRVPTGRNYADDRAPTIEEIRAILRYSDPRIKPIVLVMVSSGIRVGAWDHLRWEDIKPIQKNGSILAASIRVYAGTKDEYDSFITSETYEELKKWIDSRAEAGEKITQKSWLMRDLWSEKEQQKGGVQQRGIASFPKQLTSTGVTRLIQRALFAQGIRTKLENGKKRYEFQANHGFRKYFDSVCDRRMKTLYVEFLLGHNTGLKENYNRAQQDELLAEYLKAAPELSVLTQPDSPFASEDMESLKAKNETLEKQLSDVTRRLDEQGKILEQLAPIIAEIKKKADLDR